MAHDFEAFPKGGFMVCSGDTFGEIIYKNTVYVAIAVGALQTADTPFKIG